MIVRTALILMVLFSSCATRQICNRRFPVVADTVRVVLSHDTIIYRDTVVTVTIPGVTVTDTVLIPCPPLPPEFIPDTAQAETPLAVATAWWSYPVIRLKLVQRDTTIQFRLDSAIREAKSWRELYENITAVQPITKIPVIYQISLWAWIGAVLLILYSLIRFLMKL